MTLFWERERKDVLFRRKFAEKLLKRWDSKKNIKDRVELVLTPIDTSTWRI
jgi:hypothetical protein